MIHSFNIDGGLYISDQTSNILSMSNMDVGKRDIDIQCDNIFMGIFKKGIQLSCNSFPNYNNGNNNYKFDNIICSPYGYINESLNLTLMDYPVSTSPFCITNA
jgi:hypothetical protein